MAFAAGYYAYYELGNGSSIQQEYEHEVAAMEASRKAAAPALTFPDMTHLNVALKSGERIGAGKIVFQGKCISCHGDHGQGIIGPNLTDDYWIHGDGKPESIANTIHDGVSAKGMPPWNTLLSDEEIYSVTAYVKSLRGTNPPGAKAAQGELVKE
ncbi:MAG: c-type cytochrome [Deltaproteobacteria bacterium]|nr:c-type cytochrome [Deltaproteobacteria bacterium]